MKNKTTILREKVLRDLNAMDVKFRFDSPNWDRQVKQAFNETGSFCFENLVMNDTPRAQSLISNFI
jgi:hypothetical protein